MRRVLPTDNNEREQINNQIEDQSARFRDMKLTLRLSRSMRKLHAASMSEKKRQGKENSLKGIHMRYESIMVLFAGTQVLLL